MSRDIFDPKLYKHVKSDKNSTTLQHKKGHTITIAHNVISPKMRTALQALSKIPQEDATSSQAQESQDQHQYGKVIMKAGGGGIGNIMKFATMFSEGGGVAANDPDKAAAVANVERGSDQSSQSSTSRPMATRPTQKSAWGDDSWPSPSQTSVGQAVQAKKDANGMAKGGQVMMAKGGGIPGMAPAGHGSEAYYAYDAGLPCLNPNCKSHGMPHPNCRCYSSSSHFAEGGAVSKLRYCAHGKPHQPDCEYSTKGISEQGRDVRHGNRQSDPQEVELAKHFAREEAKGRASFERHVKPKMQGLAEGGRLKYAHGVGAIPYGMRQEDMPQEQDQPEQQPQEQDATDQSSLPEFMRSPAKAPMLKEGMPGYEEAQKPLAEDDDDDGGKVDKAMDAKIHNQDLNNVNGDQYARKPAQTQAQPIANDPGADTVRPGSDTVDVGPALQLDPAVHKQELLKEDHAVGQDLMNGHITPKTYGDLMYHNKDGSEKNLFGKIGSIFGLMLSSIGSGLSHGPNLSMQMMDNAIKNDLDGQVKDRTNNQNLFKLNQERLMNEAQIPKLVAEGKLTADQGELAQAHTAKIAYDVSNMMTNRFALQHMVEITKTLPPGPQRDQALAQLAMVSDKVDSENFNIADRAAAKQAMLHAVISGSLLGNQAGANDGSSNKNQTRAMRMVGDDKLAKEADVMEKRRMGGIEGEASRDIDGKDRDAMEKHQQLNANLQDLKQSLAKLTTLNHYSPDYVTLTGKISKLQSDIRSSQLGTVYKPSEQQLLDATLKIPASQFTEYQTRSQVDQLLNSNNRDFNTLKKSYDLPVYKEGKDGKRYKESTVNGKTYYIPVK